MDVLELSPFPNVAPGGLATLATKELNGRTVQGLVFAMGGTTMDRTHLSSIEIRAAQKTIVDPISGADLHTLNVYKGLPDDTDYLYHWFGDPTADNIHDRHIGDLDLAMYGDANLELKVLIDGTAVAPTLQMYAILSPDKQSIPGFDAGHAALVRALLQTIIQPTAAVKRAAYPVGLGSQAGARLRTITFLDPAAIVTSVELKKSGNVRWQDLPTALAGSIEKQYGRAQQANEYVLDRVADGNEGESETTVDAKGNPFPFQVLVTTSGGGTVTAVADVYTAPALI